MHQTIVALFRTHVAAQNAMDDLIGQGFSQHNLCISEGESDAATINCSPGEPHAGRTSLGHFFRDRFGTYESRHAKKFVEAIRGGQSMLAVHASSDAQVDRACAILDNHNPCDVDAYAEDWAGAIGVAPAAMQGGAAAQQGMLSQQSGLQGSQGGTAPTADRPLDRNPPGEFM
jgi:hypothetical protein